MTLTDIIPELRKETERINEAITVVEKLIQPQRERRGGPPAVLANQANNPK
jgi:hypothetical protein